MVLPSSVRWLRTSMDGSPSASWRRPPTGCSWRHPGRGPVVEQVRPACRSCRSAVGRARSAATMSWTPSPRSVPGGRSTRSVLVAGLVAEHEVRDPNWTRPEVRDSTAHHCRRPSCACWTRRRRGRCGRNPAGGLPRDLPHGDVAGEPPRSPIDAALQPWSADPEACRRPRDPRPVGRDCSARARRAAAGQRQHPRCRDRQDRGRDRPGVGHARPSAARDRGRARRAHDLPG